MIRDTRAQDVLDILDDDGTTFSFSILNAKQLRDYDDAEYDVVVAGKITVDVEELTCLQEQFIAMAWGLA